MIKVILLGILLTGCSLLFEADPEVPAKEPDRKFEPFCATVEEYSEDAGMWVKAPYDCKR